MVGRPDSQLGATITAITFLVMGVPALLIGLWGLAKSFGGRDERPLAAPGSTGAGAASGVMGRMRAGLDSGRPGDRRTEFEREKAKILAEQ